MKLKLTILFLSALFFSCKSSQHKTAYDGKSGATKIVNTIHYPQEKHLKNIKQLTFGGDNAEAYWSFDNTKLTFQANTKAWGLECDQIFMIMALETLLSEILNLWSFDKTLALYGKIL